MSNQPARYSSRGFCPAFDYTAQKWLTGIEGHRLTIAQTQTQLATLEGPQGAAFFADAKANGLTCKDRGTWAMILRGELAELQSVLDRVATLGR